MSALVLDGVKVGRIHSPPRGVTKRRCGLSSKFFVQLFIVCCGKTEVNVVCDKMPTKSLFFVHCQRARILSSYCPTSPL